MSLEEVYQRNLEHRTHRAGWLRAAVLGANDGLVSTAALMIGVAAAGKQDFIITAAELINARYALLGKGKKNNYILIIE